MQVLSPVLLDGKVIGTVTVDPRTTAITTIIDEVEQFLPTGSIIRNTTTGQKFIKIDGDEFAYNAILIAPPAEWGWSQEGIDAWAVLQSF